MRSGSQLTVRRKRETHAASPAAAAAHAAPGTQDPRPRPPRRRPVGGCGARAASPPPPPRLQPASRPPVHGQNSTHAGPSTPSTSSRRTDAQPHASTQRSPSPQSCHAPPVELGSRSWRKKPAASIMSHHLVPASRGQGWPPCVSCTRSSCGQPARLRSMCSTSSSARARSNPPRMPAPLQSAPTPRAVRTRRTANAAVPTPALVPEQHSPQCHGRPTDAASPRRG